MEAEHVFKFRCYISNDLSTIEESVYTNIDFMEELENEHSCKSDESYERLMRLTEEKVAKIYFTPEKIQEMKESLCKKIMESDNPFTIFCNDWDGGYECEENRLLENIRKIR